MRGGRMIEQLFLHRISVKPGYGAQAAGDGGPGPSAGFQVPGEELDVSPAGLAQMKLVLLAPAGELPQIQLVGLPRQAAVPGEKSG
jgi:hypothetical protein